MKRFVTMFCILLCAIALSVGANAEEIGFTYYVDDITGEMCVSGIISENTPDKIIFPSEIGGKKVTRIRNAVVVNSFGDVRFDPIDLKGAKHLVIPEGVKRIEAFVGTENIETVVLPKSVKVIPSFAFAGAKNLKSINLEWVESIGSFAFEGCSSLCEAKLLHTTKVGINAFNLINDLTIYGMKNSAAETYAENNNVNFVRLSGFEKKAHVLYNLGIMKGTGVTENGILLFDLDRAPTRAEAVTMLIRFLGKENEAQSMEKTHPFTDVPLWADGYVSYAYENGLTNGMSSTVFGADTLATPEMYLTFMLRSLGYTDEGSDKDFSYDDPWLFAMEKGITERDQNLAPFYRSEMVDMSYSTLFVTLKNDNKKMFEKMISDNVFTEMDFAYWTK